jgi:hypothetical protein
LKREFFPSIVDIGIEIDSGLTDFHALLPTLADPKDQAEARAAAEAQSALRFSSVVNQTDIPKFPLDWVAIKALWEQIKPQERDTLGVENTDVGSRGALHVACCVLLGAIVL